RRLQNDELLSDRVAAGEPHMNPGQHIVLVAVDQRDAMSDRGVESGADVVRVDYGGQVTETLRQGKSFVPREKLALLDVDVRVGKFGDRSHVIEMRMGDENRVDRVCVHADL